MAKIAKERITLSSLIATLVTEAETMGYETLVRTVKEVQEGESMRNELKAKERATTAAVRKLKTIIREEKETHEDAMSDSRKRLAQDSLFTGEDETFAFRRAISRLTEMQSEEYLGRSGAKRMDMGM